MSWIYGSGLDESPVYLVHYEATNGLIVLTLEMAHASRAVPTTRAACSRPRPFDYTSLVGQPVLFDRLMYCVPGEPDPLVLAYRTNHDASKRRVRREKGAPASTWVPFRLWPRYDHLLPDRSGDAAQPGARAAPHRSRWQRRRSLRPFSRAPTTWTTWTRIPAYWTCSMWSASCVIWHRTNLCRRPGVSKLTTMDGLARMTCEAC